MAGEEQFNLLLVDDNPTNLMLLAKIVEFDLPQVRVLTASNASDGLQLARQEQIDGAFIDVQMPQVSGLEMCRQLKADPQTAGIPLVLITAHLASPEMRAEGLEVGAYDFISQPISNVEMLARIKVMLRLRDSEQSLLRDNQQLQQQLTENASKLRWVSGLLLSGDGSLAVQDQQLLQRLAAELPEPQAGNEAELVERLSQDFPLPWRRTLLKLALLDSIPKPLARSLSEIADIEAVFTYLQRHGLSLLPELTGADQLQFKPQVRELLRQQAELQLTKAERNQVLLLAADWYRQQAQPLVALACLLRAEDYPAVSQLLSQSAFELLGDGDDAALWLLLAEVPEEFAAGCGWFSLFRGLGCLRSGSLEAGTWLELAVGRFQAEKDRRGELFAMSQQVAQLFFQDGRLELGRERLPRLRQLAAEQLELLEPGNRLTVLNRWAMAELLFEGALTKVEELVNRALAEALQVQLLDKQLECYLVKSLLAVHRGRFRVARADLEKGLACAARLPDSLAKLSLRMVGSELLFCSGELDAFRQQRQRLEQQLGKERLEQTVFAPLQAFYASLEAAARGDYARAGELLEQGQSQGPAAFNPHLASWLKQLQGWLAAQNGAGEDAEAALEQGLQLREQAGGPLCALANLLLAGATWALLQRYERAAELLQQGLDRSRQLGEERIRPGLHAWLSLVAWRQGQPQLATEQLTSMLDLLLHQRNPFFWGLTPQLLLELWPHCSDERSRQLYHQLLETRLQVVVSSGDELLPQLQVQTLGGFSLQLGEQQLNLVDAGQPSRQILALLATAPGHSLSMESLMGTLWPDSPSGKARNSFDTAHMRLRKLFNSCFGDQVHKEYLPQGKGMLSLRRAEVDSVQFAAAVEEARRQLARQNYWQAEQALWRADRLWQGEFLAGFDLDADLPYRRDQFNQLRLEQLGMLAERLQQQGDTSTATRLLQAGLLLDPTQESLIQPLLRLAEAQQNPALVRQTLRNYRQALQAEEYRPDEIDEMIEALRPQGFELDNQI